MSHVPTVEERHTARQARRQFERFAPQIRRNIAGHGFESRGSTHVIGEIVTFDPVRPAFHPVVKPRSMDDDLFEADAILRHCILPSFSGRLCRSCYYVLYELSVPISSRKVVEVIGDSGLGLCSKVMCTQSAALSRTVFHCEQCVFNHPLEVHLTEHDVEPVGCSAEPLPVRLILQVMRVESWNRHILHGFSFVDLPEGVGEHAVHAPLWAPLGTVTDQLSGKFCGTLFPLVSPHLVAAADLTSLPRNHSALRTESVSGSLHLRLNVAHQKIESSSTLEKSAVAAGERVAGLRRRRNKRGSSQENKICQIFLQCVLRISRMVVNTNMSALHFQTLVTFHHFALK